ncbi:MAG: TolC family protein, partial [Bacteroidia bacterium]
LLETPNNFGNFDFEPANNQYVGLNFHMPMFLRKQRAKAQKMLYKEEVITNKKNQSKVKIESYMAAYYANTQDLKKSVELWRSAVVNYQRMLEAEQVKFELGESSLFVVNNRELKWIDAREKYAKSYTEYRKSILRYYYTLGVLGDAIE